MAHQEKWHIKKTARSRKRVAAYNRIVIEVKAGSQDEPQRPEKDLIEPVTAESYMMRVDNTRMPQTLDMRMIG